MSAYVYMVRCADGSFYTGWSSDPVRRAKVHNSGRGAKYTRSRLPVELVYTKECSCREEALKEEYAIKQLSHAQKLRMLSTQETPTETGIKMGKLFYLMGKSAAGKDKLYEKLMENEELHLKPLVIYTTRPIRKGETDGVEYHFTDEAGMARLEKAGKVIEKRRYDTACGPWYYFTADGEVDLNHQSYLGIGTLESFEKIRSYYGEERVIPLYIEVEDGVRLERALKRERKQAAPLYEEMCRRFLADQRDFSKEKLASAGIEERFDNTEPGFLCLEALIAKIQDCSR